MSQDALIRYPSRGVARPLPTADLVYTFDGSRGTLPDLSEDWKASVAPGIVLTTSGALVAEVAGAAALVVESAAEEVASTAEVSEARVTQAMHTPKKFDRKPPRRFLPPFGHPLSLRADG